jgi:hypothetical protein
MLNRLKGAVPLNDIPVDYYDLRKLEILTPDLARL